MSQPDTQDLDQLLGYLKLDPNNMHLLAEAAHAAAACRLFERCRELLDRYRALAPLPPALLGIEARMLMGAGRFQEAVAAYRALLERLPDDHAVKSSLALALVQIGEADSALVHLDEDTTAVWPQAAELRLRLVHASGEIEAAQEEARRLLSLHPGNQSLMAAASVLAVDLGDMEAAAQLATRAGDLPDSNATLGLLDLETGNLDGADRRFARALELQPDLARAWIGQGLAAMARGATTDAIQPLRRGAEIFGTHLGSWLALGWAHLLAGQQTEAEAVFDHALDLDRTFSEARGSKAVMEALRGNRTAALREVAMARRLDPTSFSAMFAMVLMEAGEGRPEEASRLFDRALDTPIEGTDKTLRQMIAGMAIQP